jgi:hypothetical protein
MRIQCDSLKYANILEKKGIKANDADGLMSTITAIEIFNLYSKDEVNSMLNESIQQIFIEEKENRAKQDQKLAEQRREFDLQIKEQRNEALNSRRWMVGTIITVGFSLAAYLSALIHYSR